MLKKHLQLCKFRDLLEFHDLCIFGDFANAFNVNERSLMSNQPLLSWTDEYQNYLTLRIKGELSSYLSHVNDVCGPVSAEGFLTLTFGENESLISEAINDQSNGYVNIISQLIKHSLNTLNEHKTIHEIEMCNIEDYKNKNIKIGYEYGTTFLSELMEKLRNMIKDLNHFGFGKQIYK